MFFSGNELLKEIIEEVQVIVKNGQTFDLEYNADGRFYTDRKLLKNILINLLSNAIKFSPEHSSIFVKAEMKESNLVIVISLPRSFCCFRLQPSVIEVSSQIFPDLLNTWVNNPNLFIKAFSRSATDIMSSITRPPL